MSNALTAMLAAAAGVASCPALRGLIFRFAVPAGQPWRDACPDCGRKPKAVWRVPILGPLGRCPACRIRLGPPAWSIELITASVCGALGTGFSLSWALVALMWFALTGISLAFIDAMTRRLPHPLTTAAFIGTALFLSAEAIRIHGLQRLGVALLCAIGYGAVVLVMALGARGLGMGDVRLAPTLGITSGWFGVTATLASMIIAITLAGLAAIALLVTRHAGRNDYLAYGPYLIAGTLIAALLHR